MLDSIWIEDQQSCDVEMGNSKPPLNVCFFENPIGLQYISC